ncbi:hypothetical protein PHYC_01457 [Phycisphaerales bacterium]|nr:hypothetical protein PHYC_01457 [Phycisphaerales bacterium]
MIDSLRAVAPGFIPGRDQVAMRMLRDGDVCACIRPEQGEPTAWRLEPGGEAYRPVAINPCDDERLPGAGLLRDPRKVDKRLGGTVRVERVQIIGYRPENRLTARVVCEGGRVLYLKLLTRRGYAEAAANFARIGKESNDLVVTHPLAMLERECAVVLAAAPGLMLRDLLRAGTGFDAGRVAAALSSLAALPVGAVLPARSFEDERAAALRLLDRGIRWRPDLARLRERVARLDLPPGSGDQVVHTDLHDKQIFVGAKVALIDCEGMCRGDSRLDWVNLDEHLRLRAMTGVVEASGVALGAEVVARLPGMGAGDEVRRLRAVVRARIAGTQAQRAPGAEIAKRLAAEAEELCG